MRPESSRSIRAASSCTGRLPQDLTIDDDGRVGRKDEPTRLAPADRAALGLGDAADIRLGRFAGSTSSSTSAGWMSTSIPASLKQVGASRRRGSQNQHGS